MLSCRLVARVLEDLADELVELPAVRTRPDLGGGAAERLLHEPVPFLHLGRRVAEEVRPRHIRVAGGLLVLREEVEDDQLVRPDLAGAAVVADRRLRAVRHDHVAALDAEVGEHGLDHLFQPLGRQRLPVDLEAVRRLRTTQEAARRVERGLARLLRIANPAQLRLVLRAPPVVEELALDDELDAVRAQVVGKPEWKRRRHRRALDPELPHGAQRELERDGRPCIPWAKSSSWPSCSSEMISRPGTSARTRGISSAWRERHRPPSVALEVEERIRDDNRHLMPELRRTNGVAVDEDVGHGAILAMQRRTQRLGNACRLSGTGMSVSGTRCQAPSQGAGCVPRSVRRWTYGGH